MNIEIQIDGKTLITAKDAERAYIAHNIEKSMEELVTAGSWLLDLDNTSFHVCTAMAHVRQAKEVLEIYKQRLTQQNG